MTDGARDLRERVAESLRGLRYRSVRGHDRALMEHHVEALAEHIVSPDFLALLTEGERVEGWAVVCRNARTGDLHHIASGPKHMDPWTREYAEREAERIHHNNDWLACEAAPVMRPADDGGDDGR